MSPVYCYEYNQNLNSKNDEKMDDMRRSAVRVLRLFG